MIADRTAATTLLAMAVAAPAAYALARFNHPVFEMVARLFVYTYMIPGILLVLPPLRMPAVTRFVDGTGPIFAGKLFPFAFITIACGAISGFHALVASGTTPKMLTRESDARLIGYGGMLMESFVAVMAMCAAALLDPGVYFAINAPLATLGGTAASAAEVIRGWGFTLTPEQITGLARLIRANAMAALENIALWHERDISHSSVERVILPDSFIALDHMLRRFTRIVRGMVVYPERMRENLDRSRGVVFSGTVLLELARRGIAREQAYEWVQRNAMRAFHEQKDFKTLLLADEDLRRVLSAQEIEKAFDLADQLRNVDAIFNRVFGKTSELAETGAAVGKRA